MNIKLSMLRNMSNNDFAPGMLKLLIVAGMNNIASYRCLVYVLSVKLP